MKIAVIVIAAIAIVATIGVAIFKSYSDRHILDGPGMERPLCYTITACRYYTGGGMEGGSTSIEIYTGEDNKVYMSYYDCPYIGAEEESYTVEFGPMALTEIQHICYSRGLLSWGELEKDELILLDAPETTFTVTYGEGETYTISSSDKLPESASGLFGEIYKIFEMYMQGED